MGSERRSLGPSRHTGGVGAVTAYETFDVPVDGGQLRVGAWGTDGPVVVATHGITANHLSWLAVGEELGRDVRLFAPDLRGRGRSRLPGPYGMEAHARDLIAVLDAVGVDRAVLVGHSMGAYVAVVAAANHPERISGVVMVDGGVPFPAPPGLDVATVLKAVVGPAIARLTMTFPSREAYREFWQEHPALTDWDERIWSYLDYDLVGVEPELRSSVSVEAVHDDGADLVERDPVSAALGALTVTPVLLRAERGLMNDGPLLPDALVEAWPAVEDRGRVSGTNHYTIVFHETGVQAIAAEVRSTIAG